MNNNYSGVSVSTCAFQNDDKRVDAGDGGIVGRTGEQPGQRVGTHSPNGLAGVGEVPVQH